MLNRIEHIGNRLPDPASLFVLLIVCVLLSSWWAATAKLTAIHPQTGAQVTANNLFSAATLRWLLTDMPTTFASFPPLGMVLVIMLGIGVADKSGLIAALLKSVLNKIPPWLLSAGLVFTGIMSSLAADAGYVVLIPLGGALFYAAGRPPLAGIAATFAGVSAGFSANLLLTAVDAVLAGLTQAAAHIVEPDYVVPITVNYYLMAILTPILTIVGAWLTDYIVEPRLRAANHDTAVTVDIAADSQTAAIDSVQKRGLFAALCVTVVVVLLVLYWVLPSDGVLRSAAGDLQPFYQSLIALICVLFFTAGTVYGVVTRRIHNDRDVVNMAADSMADMGHYLVLSFLAAHFIALFKASQLGLILAVQGAEILQSVGHNGVLLMLGLVLVAALINLLVGSASAKWAILAPVFVPLLMLLGYAPGWAQAAYRIGDSVTNVLTPFMPYFPLVIVFVKKYQPTAGIGTLVAMMLPYSLGFAAAATGVLLIFLVFGMPLGPG